MNAVAKFALKHKYAYIVLNAVIFAILFTLIESIIEPFPLFTHEGLLTLISGLIGGIVSSIILYFELKKKAKKLMI